MTETQPSADQPSAAEGAVDDTPQQETVPLAPSPLAEVLLRLQGEARNNYERLLRSAADLENFKRRTKRDQTEGVRRAEDAVVMHFLPVIDNLQRAIEHAEKSDGERQGEGFAALADGVKMVHKQFIAALERIGIVAFDSLGQPFDPELHEAIQQQPSDEPRGKIIAEFQQGYKRESHLVRPAMVVVSMGRADGPVDAADIADAGAEDQ
ncbi:MAG: nucleotide exchange factor GrpE [Deltaproteobacteria bacterium]|nr:nucleotide exchange factor GrpE [Deltaproteobacteria bacterium]